MEDENKVKKVLNIIKIIIIAAVIILIIWFIYNKYQTYTNTNNFQTYLKNNNYKKNNDGIYYKNKTNNNITTTDKAGTQEYLFARTSAIDSNNYTSTTIEYTKDKKINITYQIEGFDENNNYGVLYQTGTYFNNKFECKIVTNIGFETKCDLMKKQAKEYEKEINNLLKQNKINPKYIKIDSKKDAKV